MKGFVFSLRFVWCLVASVLAGLAAAAVVLVLNAGEAAAQSTTTTVATAYSLGNVDAEIGLHLGGVGGDIVIAYLAVFGLTLGVSAAILWLRRGGRAAISGRIG